MKRMLIAVVILIGSLACIQSQTSGRVYISPELQNHMEIRAPLVNGTVPVVIPGNHVSNPVLQEIVRPVSWDYAEPFPGTWVDYKPIYKGKKENIALPCLPVKNR